ncbi:MAG TPA: hypothetical protein ENK59_03385 [Thioploca sp.]|nr:hypothetical protein [Thioploca sp.]
MQNIIITTIAMLFIINVQAFDLFNPDRGKPAPKPIKSSDRTNTGSSNKLPIPFKAKASIKPTINKRPKNLLPQKDFALKGTSIIGNKRAAILIAPNKKEFIQYLKSNKRTKIDSKYIKSEKYQSYYLLNVAAREVQIEYPINAPCRKDKDKDGVKCIKKSDGITIAALSLKERKALRPKRTPAAIPNINKKRNKNLEKRKEIYKNFKRKVIKDEDVPPGMRVVRTPFGDRLVPIK